jgi:Holliday junction resolvase RusA-like endonuclease
MLLTTAQRDYRMAVNHVVRENRVAKFTGPVGVSIVLEPKTRARYDCDNFCKSILDALTGANVWVDDGQVQTLRVSKAAPRAGGRATVLVYEMTGEMLNA